VAAVAAAVEATVWFGQVPEIVTFEPATSEGVAVPLPPFATGKAVPEYAIASVPDVVIGEPVTDKKDGTVAATEDTVPAAAALLASNFTTPAEFLKYSFSSTVLIASSPAARLPAMGKAAAVELL
jgi:hypothetical protein